MANRSEVPYGTLDLMVLKTLESLGPLHGYGIARRIEQVAEGALELAFVNAGAECQLAFWQLSADLKS